MLFTRSAGIALPAMLLAVTGHHKHTEMNAAN
jgi:hypothetical protein